MNTYRNLTDIEVKENSPVWGARMISERDRLDLVHDRQATEGDKDRVTQLLLALNKGPIGYAIKDTERRFRERKLDRNGEEPFVMYRDEEVLIRGNPNASYGYLYVTACFVSDLIEEV